MQGILYNPSATGYNLEYINNCWCVYFYSRIQKMFALKNDSVFIQWKFPPTKICAGCSKVMHYCKYITFVCNTIN